MDFFKNRFCGDGHCIFFRNFLCKKEAAEETDADTAEETEATEETK